MTRSGYLARLRPLAAAGRYVAYTSDIGESFRPVVSPRTVTAAYGISWAYLIGDVVFESVKARARAEETAPDYVSQIVGLTCVLLGLSPGVRSHRADTGAYSRPLPFL